MSEVINPILDIGHTIISQTGKVAGLEPAYTPDVYQASKESFQASPEEKALTQALLARSRGEGMSPAQLQMQQALAQQASQAQGMAAAQRGVSPALALRQAQQAAAMAGQQTAGQQAILRAQEAIGAEQLAQQGLQSQRAGLQGYEELRTKGSLGQEQMMQQAGEKQTERFGEMLGAGASALGKMAMAKGGLVPDDIHNFAMAIGQHVGSLSMQKGGEVLGKAKVPHDSEENDIVPAMLSPGEVVIPRSIAKKSPEEIAQFIMALRGGM